MRKFFSEIDWFLFFPYILLCGIGIVMVYSSSAGIGLMRGGMAKSYMIKQLIFVVISVISLLVMSRINFKLLRSQKFIVCFTLIMVSLLCYLKFKGATINGAAGWISFGGVSLQPAELCKFFFITYFAYLFWKRQQKIVSNGLFKASISNVLPFFIPTVMLALILIQPDTGGFAINLFIIIAMFAAASKSTKSVFAWAILCFAGPCLLLWLFINPIANWAANSHSYQLQRFVSFNNPFLHAQSSGQQLINSYYAISNGGIFGRGLGNSIQKMGYLAEPNTDFILPIISEELGLIGVIVVLGLLFVMIVRIIDIGFKTTNIYYSSICYGTAAYFVIQTLFNAGGAVGIVPLTGVALPFISYGGSSLLTLSLCLGMVLNISRIEKIKNQHKLKHLR